MTSADDTISLDFLQRQQQRILDEMQGIREQLDLMRRDYLSIARNFSGMSDLYFGTKRRIDDLGNEFETIVKIEVMGSTANLETRIDNLATGLRFEMEEGFDKVNTRLDLSDGRLDKMDVRLNKMDARLDKMDDRLDKIDSRLDKFDARFDRLEELVLSLKS